MQEYLLGNLENVAVFLGIILATIIVAFGFNRFFRRIIRLSTDVLKNDPTNYIFLRHTIIGLIYVIGFSLAIYMMPDLRALASSLLAGAGILAVAVGFASQHALSNIVSGVFIVIFKPFRVNDRLQFSSYNGVVEDITLRHTVIRDFENRRILIPNSVISNEILVNADFGDERICKWIEINISYESDLDRAKDIMRKEVLAHPLNIDSRTAAQIAADEEQVPVRVIALSEFGVNLRAWAWAKDNADAFSMGCDLLESIKKRFDDNGIEIPYPHRSIIQKETQKKEGQLQSKDD